MASVANKKDWMVFFMIAFLSITRPYCYVCRFRYFSTDVPGMGCDEQNGLPVSMGKMQRQPLAQGLLMPQLPPQVVRELEPVRN